LAPKPTYEELEKENLRLKRTIEELRVDQEKYRAELESRVRARMAEMTAANRRLEQEIVERKQTEDALREREQELENETRDLEEVNYSILKIVYTSPLILSKC
jgi:hypothetical protein